jgi:hypothetical protein
MQTGARKNGTELNNLILWHGYWLLKNLPHDHVWTDVVPLQNDVV